MLHRTGYQEKNFFTSSGTPDIKKKSFSRRPARRISRKNLFHVVRRAGFQKKVFFASSGTPDIKKKTFSCRPTRRISRKSLFHVVRHAGYQEKNFFASSDTPDTEIKLQMMFFNGLQILILHSAGLQILRDEGSEASGVSSISERRVQRLPVVGHRPVLQRNL
jgi:hypothetical protein